MADEILVHSRRVKATRAVRSSPNPTRFGYGGRVRVRVFGGAALVAVTLFGAWAQAVEPAPPAAAPAIIAGPSTCPGPAAVWAELITLVPPDRLGARLRAMGSGKTPPVEIFDLGLPYRIVAAGQVREYRDDRRDCAARARIAAVFVALALDPAEIAPPPSPLPIVAPPAAPPPPVETAPDPRTRIDLGAAAQAGLGPDEQAGLAGLELRWTSGRRALAPAAGVTALLPVDAAVGGVRLRQWRLPIDAGVRARLGGRRFLRSGELGLCLAVVSARALDLASSRGQTGVEIGVRAAFAVHLATRGHFAPFASLSAELVPDPPSVFALPVGVAGHTPLLWLGASVGISLGVL
jgi:hypothetical protein